MAKVRLNEKSILKKINKIKKKAIKAYGPILQEEIISTIQSGNSPVQGFGRYEGYSDVYLDAIEDGRYFEFAKNPRPVNLTLSGKMMDKFFTKSSGNKLFVGFDSEIALFHNELGAGKSKVIRRMLPTKPGEKFKKSIRFRLKEVLRKITKNILK